MAVIHCNAQTAPTHVLQKLSQTCMVITTNTGRVYKPKECERLILYLKDLNLPKPDKWGTSQLVAFVQQVGHPLNFIYKFNYDTAPSELFLEASIGFQGRQAFASH